MEHIGEGRLPNPERRTPLTLTSWQSTVAREHWNPNANEDRLLNEPTKGFFGVFDGMGGYLKGEVCSQTARDYFADAFGSLVDASPEKISEELPRLIQEASARVYDALRLRSGTTFSGGIITKTPEGSKAIIAVVGDSPVYLVRNGEIVWVSDIHSATIDKIVQQKGLTGEKAQEEKRRIARKLGQIETHEDFERLSPEEQECYRERHLITDALV